MHITQKQVLLLKLQLKDTVTASGVQGWDTEVPKYHEGRALSAFWLEEHRTKADRVATFEK